MAKKSKGFSELLNLQRQEKEHQAALEKFQDRVQQGPLKDKITKVVTNPKDQQKMSEVLEAFVEPYRDTAENFQQQEKLIAVAILAWNLALLPEDQRQSEMEKVIQQVFGGQGRRAKQDAREIVEELIARKLTLFADNKRYIVDFQLQETPQSYHLSVMSTLIDPSTAK